VGPEVFPYIASVGLLLCAVGLFFKKDRKDGRNGGGPFLDKQGWIRVLKLSALLVSFPIVFTYFGFIIAALLLLYVMISLFDLGKEETVFKKGLVSVVVTAILYVLFVYLVKINLPIGKFFELFM
jgi:hypothetical protein